MALIIRKTDDFFETGCIGIVYRDNTNNIYGFIYNDHVELYKPTLSDIRWTYINHKMYDRITDIFYNKKDERVKQIYPYILKETLPVNEDDLFDYLWVLQYKVSDLY